MQLQSPGGPEPAAGPVASPPVPASERPADTPAADSPRLAAQGSGLRGLWLLRLGRTLRAGGLHQQAQTRRTMRRTAQAVRQDTPGQRVQHRGLRLLPGCAADRGRWCQIGADRRQAPHRPCGESRQVILGRTDALSLSLSNYDSCVRTCRSICIGSSFILLLLLIDSKGATIPSRISVNYAET